MLHATNTSSLTESIRDYKILKHRACKHYVLYKQEERKTDRGKKCAVQQALKSYHFPLVIMIKATDRTLHMLTISVHDNYLCWS